MTAPNSERLRLAGDPHRPRYHFLPPANWLNDPNGLIHWRGQYHMFYQHNPIAAHWGVIHWGHAVSDDLVHWRDLPIALSPTPGSPDADGCWSGCIVDDGGVPTMIYTGLREKQQRPCLATSDDDLLTWAKYAGNPLIAAPPPEFDQVNFRDHCVWKDGDSWYQVIGSGVPEVGGAALLYRSQNLRDWEFLHPLCTGLAGETGVVWECPDFFPLGDTQHILAISPIPLRKSLYLVGSYAEQRFTPASIHDLDIGGHFYAPQSFRDESGRRIMFGWLWEGRSTAAQNAAGWAGVMSLPRVLSAGNDGQVEFRPAPELATLRGTQQHWDQLPIAPGAPAILGAQGDSLELIVTFAPTQADSVGVDLRRSPDGQEYTRVVYDRAQQRLSIDRLHASASDEDQHDIHSGALELADGEPLRLHIFVDRSVIEVFASNRVCAASRVYPSRPDSLGVALFTEGGPTEAQSIDVWQIESIL